MTGVLLVNPKSPFNVGAVLRACAIFGVPILRWTGVRVRMDKMRRLPREERLKDYTGVDWYRHDLLEDALSQLTEKLVPVCVEVTNPERLDTFEHPQEALYVFGPEDGDVPGVARAACHRFVRIPTLTRTPLNLAAAVNVVLYDRHIKEWGHRSTAAEQAAGRYT